MNKFSEKIIIFFIFPDFWYRLSYKLRLVLYYITNAGFELSYPPASTSETQNHRNMSPYLALPSYLYILMKMSAQIEIFKYSLLSFTFTFVVQVGFLESCYFIFNVQEFILLLPFLIKSISTDLFIFGIACVCITQDCIGFLNSKDAPDSAPEEWGYSYVSFCLVLDLVFINSISFLKV